jgi:membrane peptidoglycan carboxypeptidase
MNSRLTSRRLRARRERHGGGALRALLICILGLSVLGSICAAAGVGALFAVYNSYASDYVPIAEKLHQNSVGLTEIYDRGGPTDGTGAGGVKLGDLTNPDAQLLDPVTLDKISPWMVQATISTEDNTFESNPGVNITGTIRAVWENYVGGGIGSGTGGSSITQQLIKNVYICPSVGSDDAAPCTSAARTGKEGIDRKLREIIYAIELDKDYTKDQILQWYLNQISYADRYIGVQAAAQGYFHKDAIDLTLGEAALLAGIPQAPTTYHPRLNCAKDDNGDCIVDAQGRTTVTGDAKTRQEEVLDLMVTHGRASQDQIDAAKADTLQVYAASNDLKASAFIDDQVEPYLVRMCEAGVLPRLPAATNCSTSIHSAGWKVTTTLDWAETDAAEKMVQAQLAAGLAKGCQCNNASVVTIEPTTGQVIVYVPNRDPKNVTDRRVAGDIDEAVEINQPGSSFKPAVYLAWMDDNNKNPMSIIWDTSPLTDHGVVITDPRSDGGNEGLITARAGLGGSQNVPAYRVAQEVGVDNVIAMAKKLGITTLDQNFDPTFRSHPDVQYGASIATGGANVRVIDMAYMNATISNMGQMIGVPTYARTVPLNQLKSRALDTGADYDTAQQQRLDFARGNIRIPGTRDLDPVVILRVQDSDGNVLYDHDTANDLKKEQVVNAGSVWLLQSIQTDCTARFIIWGCGGSNTDTGLDAFMADGTKIPEGIKTGTQQGPLSAVDTLATWMNGYSRYAATAVWVGNADKSLVKDGPAAGYASANATTTLFKSWMGAYHTYLQSKGVFTKPANFDSLRPANVAQREIASPTTDRVFSGGGCDQKITAWVRTDVTYAAECEEKDIDSRNGFLATDQTPAQFKVTKKFVKLATYLPELATALAKARNIPIAPTEKSNGSVAVALTNITNGKTVNSSTDVIGTVNPSTLKNWKLEVGPGAAPTTWTTIGSGTAAVNNASLGRLDVSGLTNGVYTIRLTTDDGKGLATSATFNLVKGATSSPSPFGSITPNPGSRTTPTSTSTSTSH